VVAALGADGDGGRLPQREGEDRHQRE
jgi:hypothetical protein